MLTAFELTPGGSSTVYIYTQTIHRTTQLILEEEFHVHLFVIINEAHGVIRRRKTVNAEYEAEAQALSCLLSHRKARIYNSFTGFNRHC